MNVNGHGKFITFEGIDGCGKTTQAALLSETLKYQGYKVLQLREPGGSAISEKIRTLLLDPTNNCMSVRCELLLYEAARTQLVSEIIEPALASGNIVICDRFYDSTTAYQGFAGGLDIDTCIDANHLAIGNCVPDLTLVYDLDVDQAVRRIAKRSGNQALDRMEAKGLDFQRKVAKGFETIALEEPSRVELVDASKSIETVALNTIKAVEQHLGISVSYETFVQAFKDLV